MVVSIIIVNYNVKFFLEQCLYSIERSAMGDVEVIVVDNNSNDGSIAYLEPRFPKVRFIRNENNAGFAKACNQGAAIATGDFLLFLNPDTLLAEDTLDECIRFFSRTPDAGAVGVRMVDGGGRFLKESKRSFPHPLTSLFKLVGLARAFPRSSTFSRYHLGHLSATANHEVDVLAGAFMMVRREVLQHTGSFDESFFMYGEDVDLSYRIQESGFKNYYVADTTIIHFKGESTKRGSLNYVRMFYRAMSIFVQKHYGGAEAKVFRAFIHIAIWLRATLSAAAKFVTWIGLPVVDAVLILLAFWSVKWGWENFIRPDTDYPEGLLVVALPAFTLVYGIVAYYAGLYNRFYRQANLFRSTIIATVVLLALYALLPEKYRFSRGILFFGALFSFLLISGLRSLMLKTGLLQLHPQTAAHPSILIAGTPEDVEEVKSLLPEAVEKTIIGRLAPRPPLTGAVADMKDLCATAAAFNAREIVLCSGALTFGEMVQVVQDLNGCVRVRIHARGSGSIIGSDTGSGSGEVRSAEPAFRIAEPGLKRLKRLVDVGASLLFLVTFPLHLLLVKNPARFFLNCANVLRAKKTWIGYADDQDGLPLLRAGVLAPNGLPKSRALLLPHDALHLVDYWYARDYSPLGDLQIISKNYIHLGS